MKYLITGGKGFIGSHLTRQLRREGHDVVTLDLHITTTSTIGMRSGEWGGLLSASFQGGPLGSYRFVQGDVRDHRILGPLMRDIDGVFHLAAVVGFANVMSQMRETITTNTAGTETVLHHALLRGIPVLLTSTSACYGRATNDAFPVREDQDGILGPTKTTSWSYAYAKAVDEALAFSYHAEYGLPVVIARVFNTVGPGQSARAGFVLPRFVEAALTGRPLDVHAPGNQARTFCHVRDVVRALSALMRTDEAVGELVNVGGTERCTMLELARRVVSETHSYSTVRVVPPPYGDGYDNVTDRCPDITKLKRLVGFGPELTLEDMIRDVALSHMQEVAA